MNFEEGRLTEQITQKKNVPVLNHIRFEMCITPNPLIVKENRIDIFVVCLRFVLGDIASKV